MHCIYAVSRKEVQSQEDLFRSENDSRTFSLFVFSWGRRLLQSSLVSGSGIATEILVDQRSLQANTLSSVCLVDLLSSLQEALAFLDVHKL